MGLIFKTYKVKSGSKSLTTKSKSKARKFAKELSLDKFIIGELWINNKCYVLQNYKW